MTEDELKNFITSYDSVERDARSTDEWALYSLKGEVMAALSRGKTPVRLVLRCDKNLARELKTEYESVVNPISLSKNNFIQVLLVGQLKDNEVKDLIRHAYEMTRGIME